MIQVGFIGPAQRDEFARLALRVEERGAELLLLDPREGARIRFGPEREEACGHDLSKLRGVYVADLGLPASAVRAADGSIDEEASARALATSRRQLAAWNALLERLDTHANVINPPRTHDLHALKPWEMETARVEGWPAPATYATSDAEALARVAATSGSLIRKGMVGGYGYTTTFANELDAAAATALVEAGPVMVQERIEGDNVRAFVVGSSVIGGAVIVPSDGAEVDSRRDTGRVARIELSDEAQRVALAAATHWGLPFCAVDFMLESGTGRFVLLECNSAPFFVTFERTTGIDVSSPLADLLLGRR